MNEGAEHGVNDARAYGDGEYARGEYGRGEYGRGGYGPYGDRAYSDRAYGLSGGRAGSLGGHDVHGGQR